jgi:hypothetical protein
MSPDPVLRAVGAALGERSRLTQGLPAKVRDPEAVSRLVALIGTTRPSAKQPKAGDAR